MSIVVAVQQATDETELPDPGSITLWANAAAAKLKANSKIKNNSELTVRIVDEAESASLNQQFRNKNNSTNVLSFSYPAPPIADAGEEIDHLGDLVICAPVVAREAKQQNKSSAAHWSHITVHGVLHLYGFDHETGEQAEQMESLEAAILADLGFANPYATAN